MAGNKPYNEVTLKLDTNVKSAIELWVLYGIDPGSFARHMLAGDLHAAIASMHELLAEHFIDHYKYTQIVIRNWHPEFPIKDWRGWLNLEEEEAREFNAWVMNTNDTLYQIIYEHQMKVVHEI